MINLKAGALLGPCLTRHRLPSSSSLDDDAASLPDVLERVTSSLDEASSPHSSVETIRESARSYLVNGN